MYHFAVVALFALVALKLVEVIVEMVPSVAKARTLLTLAVGVALAVGLDYSLFGGFAIVLRESWMGTVATGLVIASLTTAWSAVFGWLGAGGETGASTGRESRGRPRIAA